MKRLILILLFLASASIFANEPNYDYDSSEQSNTEIDRDYEPEPKPHPKRVIPNFSAGFQKLYSYKLCQDEQYKCIKVTRKKNWHSLFPNERERDIVKRVNRTNLRLQVGQPLAIPLNLESASLLELAPFDRKMDTQGKKLILVSLTKLAFGAYDTGGNLVYWGPVSGGRDICPEGNNQSCNTVSGIFNVYEKKGEKCKSNLFPADRGGAPMPYCMFFLSGFALHGAAQVPGYNASHGCVRLYKEDAKWLNQEFVETPSSETDFGTKVIVLTADNLDQSQFNETVQN